MLLYCFIPASDTANTNYKITVIFLAFSYYYIPKPLVRFGAKASLFKQFCKSSLSISSRQWTFD